MTDVVARSPMRTLSALLVSGLAVTVVAVVGGFASGNSGDEYAVLRQPSWAPPGWLFGPVWTTLYALMALAAWLVWRSGPFTATRSALTVYGVQLALNMAWTPLFFGLGWRGTAFVEIVVLWCAVVATIVLFRRHSPWAATLLLPYWAWTTFAAVLNFAVWRLNA
jgi:tryptophan-rich sensory protein